MFKTPSILLLLAASAVVAPSVAAIADDTPYVPILIQLPPERVFAPRSFDNNDNAQITVTGTFSSTCFRVAPPLVEVSDTLRTVRIQNRAFFYTSTLCQRMTVPYTTTIDLGVLRAYRYKIEFARADAAWIPMSQIQIADSKNPGPDDYLYALSTDVRVEPAEASATKTMRIEGILLNDCMLEPEINVFYREPDVIEVLPIVTTKASQDCKPAATPFVKTVELKTPWSGPTLVHVRSLNGQSFNKVVTFATE